MNSASIQARLDLTSIREGVACFGSGPRTEYCGVLEVAGSQVSLSKVDEAKQEELLAAYAQFLNALTFPLQLLVRVTPIDLAWYVVRVEERARSLSSELVAIARDHAAFVQGLARHRTLLERRIYMVVPCSRAELPAASGANGLGNRVRPLGLWVGTKRQASDDDQYVEETVVRTLNARCDEVSRQLGRAGLRTTRLDDLGLAQLFHACWAPELARAQRIRRELTEYTALVVGASAVGRAGTHEQALGAVSGHTSRSAVP
jgi:hypothetical protein